MNPPVVPTTVPVIPHVVIQPTMVSKETIALSWAPADVQADFRAKYSTYHPDGTIAWSPYWIKKITWSDGSVTYALS